MYLYLLCVQFQFDYKGLSWQGHSIIKLNTSLATSVPLEGFDKTGKSISKIVSEKTLKKNNNKLIH